MSKLMIFLSVLAFSLWLGACQPKEVDLLFETVEQRDASGTGQIYQDTQPGLIVIATPEETASLGGLVTSEAQAQLQNLNYNIYFAIAIFQGRKPTTRYGVQIEHITHKGNIVTVHALFKEPQPGEPKGDEVTSPYHLVRVQKGGPWKQTITFNLIVGNAIVTSLSHYIP